MASFSEREQLEAVLWAFKVAAAKQVRCAVTGDRHEFDWEAHHVVEKAELKRMGIPKLKRYDERNALRVKTSIHAGHTSGVGQIPMRCLTDDNLRYAFEVLGDQAIDYLLRKYKGTDSRFEAMVNEQ
jgi:hypothetical protein